MKTDIQMWGQKWLEFHHSLMNNSTMLCVVEASGVINSFTGVLFCFDDKSHQFLFIISQVFVCDNTRNPIFLCLCLKNCCLYTTWVSHQSLDLLSDVFPPETSTKGEKFTFKRSDVNFKTLQPLGWLMSSKMDSGVGVWSHLVTCVKCSRGWTCTDLRHRDCGGWGLD